MVVHAHPDDEVFSTGGIIAKYAARGDRVVAVYATRGEAGEMHDPDRNPEEAIPRLGQIREQEVREAGSILGVTDTYFLDYRDSGMQDTEDNKNPNAFMNAPLDEAAKRLLQVMRETRPQVVVTYNEHGGYGHPDHIMTNRVTLEAFKQAQGEPWSPQKLYYGASSREGFRRQMQRYRELGIEVPWIPADYNFDDHGLPDADITAHVDISQTALLKQRALAVHRTQIPADFFYLTLPADTFATIEDVEYFVRVFPPHREGEREGDLFLGTTGSVNAA
jgi:LmbE family N-acetylglucosaminyl deacetylase